MKNCFIWIICLVCGLSSLQAQQSLPYKNPLLPTEVRVNDLLQRMTLTLIPQHYYKIFFLST